jgi:hypothetical protein
VLEQSVSPQVSATTPATLNGDRWNIQNNPATLTGPAWVSGTKTVTLKVPYKIRSDFAENNNGENDEEYAETMMAPGDQISGFTISTQGSVQINVPPASLVS